MATVAGALLGNLQNFFWRQERTLKSSRWLGECAVATTVAAQHCEWNEHLGRERHSSAMVGVAYCASSGHEFIKRGINQRAQICGEILGLSEGDAGIT